MIGSGPGHEQVADRLPPQPGDEVVAATGLLLGESLVVVVACAGGQPALQQFEITGGTRPDLEPEPISQQAGVPPQPSAPPHPAGDRTSGLYRSPKPAGCHGRTTVGGIRSTRVAP